MPLLRWYKYVQVFFFFFIVFFLSAILTSRFIEKGDLVSVPDLSGRTLAEAKKELAEKKLGLQEAGVLFNDRWERGRIVLQDPASGSRVRVNKSVKVVVSAGTEMVDIPSLVGRSLEAAVKALGDIGLQKGLISQIHTPQYAAGRIIAQEPAPGSLRVKRNSSVNLLVSQGELEPKYVMPDLIGRKAAPTIARLNEIGFKVADVRYSYYPGLDAGIIIKQFPAHGYGVAKRNLISLEVSR
jgi:serine/threonine-protein kinase